MARFEDSYVDKAALFSLGIDRATGTPYLSIPVANRMVTYDEYYALTPAQAGTFAANRDAAAAFAQECRRRQHDNHLILQPGSDRGSAI